MGGGEKGSAEYPPKTYIYITNESRIVVSKNNQWHFYYGLVSFVKDVSLLFAAPLF